MKAAILTLPGDGIGPEIISAAKRVLSTVADRFGHEFVCTDALIGGAAIDATGNPLPEETKAAALAADAVLLGAVGGPKWDNAPVRPEAALLGIRKHLGLYANLRPARLFPALAGASSLKPEILARGIDLVIVRELTGGIYFGERGYRGGKFGREAFDTECYSEIEIERVARIAYELAEKRGRRMCLVDKANVLASSRLWRKVAQEVAQLYPDVTTDYMFVDNAAMRMIQEPTFFDVMVTENTFGDILTDEGSCISGSMGLLPSASTGESTPVFEPIHGSWPQAAGMNIANPLAQILSVAMLFEHFDCQEEARLIRRAVDASLDACVRTPEIQVEGGERFGTKEVGDWITDYIRKA